MTHSTTIERISTPSVEDFRLNYVLPQKPVIFTDLFAGQKLAEISTVEQATALLGDAMLEVKEEFMTSLGNKMNVRPREFMTFREFLAFAASHPETKKMSTEGAFPPEVRALFEAPAHAYMSTEPDDDVTYQFFLGNAGNFACLHFDGDYRHVIHHQVFGEKRVTLIPHTQSKKLNPVRNYSPALLENFSEADRAAFLRYVGGSECVLGPGDTLFMPACIWHHLEYTRTSMSLSIRFGRNKYTRFLGEHFHANMHLLSVASKMLDESMVDARYLAEFREMKQADEQHYFDLLSKARHLQELFESLYARICPESIQATYSSPHLDGLAETFLRMDAERLYRTGTNLSAQLSGWGQLLSSQPKA